MKALDLTPAVAFWASWASWASWAFSEFSAFSAFCAKCRRSCLCHVRGLRRWCSLGLWGCLLPCALLWLPTPAPAQTQTRQAEVFRCGPDGRDLRDSPCPVANPTSPTSPVGPSASTSIRYDQPSDADSRAARQRHLAEASQASALAAARRASEAQARRQPSPAVALQALPPPARAASSPATVQLKPPKTARPHRPKPSSAAASAGR